MNTKLKVALGLSALALTTSAVAQITFYEGENFRGRTFTTDKRVGNFERFGFNDRASSVVVERGRWEVCEHPRFEGRCVVLRRGSYDSLQRMGMNNQISSVRPMEGSGPYSGARQHQGKPDHVGQQSRAVTASQPAGQETRPRSARSSHAPPPRMPISPSLT